jgi:hypothetical protein
VDVSRVQRTHSSEDGHYCIFQRERWRKMVTNAGTIAELTWDDLDFGNLTDSRHFHISSFYLQSRVDDLETAGQKLANIVPLEVVKLETRGDGTTRNRTRREPFKESRIVDAWVRGIVSTQAFCTNICTAATYRFLSRLAISLGLSPTRAREESRLFATLPTARNSLKNIVWESKKLRT